MATKSLYTFHPLADEQQTNIWIYTYHQWGAKQADTYIEHLHKKLSQVISSPELLRDLPKEIDTDIKFFHYERHYVFVRKASRATQNKLQVLMILHDRMDIPAAVRELLEQL